MTKPGLEECNNGLPLNLSLVLGSKNQYYTGFISTRVPVTVQSVGGKSRNGGEEGADCSRSVTNAGVTVTEPLRRYVVVTAEIDRSSLLPTASCLLRPVFLRVKTSFGTFQML